MESIIYLFSWFRAECTSDPDGAPLNGKALNRSHPVMPMLMARAHTM